MPQEEDETMLRRNLSLSRRRSFKSGRDRDDRVWSLLHIGAKKGDLKQLVYFASIYHDVNVVAFGPQSKGITPLHLAAEDGHLDVMNELLDRDANIDAHTKGVSGCCSTPGTPLHSAAEERKRKAVKFLIENGAVLPDDIDDCRFNPPLHYYPGLEWAYEEMKRLQLNSFSDP